jgi:FkbM family methyltransferase
MIAVNLGRHIGNQLYKFAFPIYRPLYSTFKRYADRTERGLLRRHLPPGSVVVDAGANIGIYSEFLSHCVGPTGWIHSFEPDPHNFARLHAALSETPNVRLNKLALSDRTGESTLYVSDDLNVDHRAYPTEGEPRREVAIRSVRLDGYFRPRERVDLIKMDIQGYELHALRGAERVLQENTSIKLLLELWPHGLKQAGTTWNDLITYLKDRGFELHEALPVGLRPFRAGSVRETPEWYLNLFASR